MSFLNRLFGSLRKRSALDSDIEEEQRYHLELAARELEGQGFACQEARRRAAVRFGSRAEAREETRRQDLLPWIDAFGRDLRIAWRGLRHSPSYSAVVLVALALGIGANTAIYSVVHAALFRALPYPEADRLAFIYTSLSNGRRTWANFEDIQDWARDSRTLRSIAAFTSQTVNLTGAGDPDRLRGGFVSANFFSTLGVPPLTGRSFLPGETVLNGPRVAIASWGVWQQKFGGDPDFLNSKILLNGEPYTVIGILPREFDFPLDRIDVWMPFQTWPAYRPGRASINAAAVSRLRRGATLAAAAQELTGRVRALGQEYPETNRDRIGARVVEFHDLLVEDLRPQLLMLGGAVLLAFFVVCANIATLNVSRVLSRKRELGIRAALGAGRARLMAHLFSEQLLLCFGGGGFGLVLAYCFTRLVVLSDLLPRLLAPRVEWPVVFAALALAILSTVFTGPLPAISLLRGIALDVSAGGRSSTEPRAANRMRSLLVTASIAISVPLLAGAGLLVRSFNAVAGIDLGFDPRNLLTLEYRMPISKYPKPVQQIEFHRRVAEEVSSLPGVRSASVMLALPFSGNGSFEPYEVVGRAPVPNGSEPRAQTNRVDPRYFETMGIPLLRGRVFTPADRLGSRRVAIVSKSMADHCWPGVDPLNRQLVLLRGDAGPNPFTVVGVVGDSKHSSLEEESKDKAYVAFAQLPHIFGTLAVRTSGNAMGYAAAVRQAVWKVDKDQPVWKVRTMESLIDLSVTDRRLLARLMSGFSAFALLLATVGLYGVVSYAVARRTKELGIRAAMGATRRVLVAMVLRDGLRAIAIGLALGLASAIPASRLLRSQMFDTSVTDAAPYVYAVLVLIAAALLATAIPARRVAALNVADVLRQD
jgi:putative ABC transport system permease protein